MLAVARSATGSKCDGFLKRRARQVQMLVMRQASSTWEAATGDSTGEPCRAALYRTVHTGTVQGEHVSCRPHIAAEHGVAMGEAKPVRIEWPADVDAEGVAKAPPTAFPASLGLGVNEDCSPRGVGASAFQAERAQDVTARRG